MAMRRYSLSIYLGLLVLLLTACGGGNKTMHADFAGDTIVFRHAENLTMVRYDGYTVATLRNPWDTLRNLHTYVMIPQGEPLPKHLPTGTIVRTPLTKVLAYSSVHCSLLQQLGVIDAVAGVCDVRYIQLEELLKRCRSGKVWDCGSALNPNIERVVELNPEAVLLSPFENSGGYGRIEKVGVELIECADYMETSALGRAEWMRFYGALFGVEACADSLFNIVEHNYLQQKQRAASAQSRLSALTDLKTGGTWYVPGGKSTVGGLLKDACVNYAWMADNRSGSLPLSFEAVYEKSADADVWFIRYNRERDLTYADLASDFVGYTAFKAFKQRKVYGCNTSHVPFYEETPFRPDYLLADFVQIFHPELEDMDGLRYFCPLEE